MKSCPQCHLLLEPVSIATCTLLACRSCGGTWIPYSALRALIESDEAELVALNVQYPGISSPGMFAGLRFPCPDCPGLFLELAPVEGVTNQAHICSRCGGAWFTPADRASLNFNSQPAQIV